MPAKWKYRDRETGRFVSKAKWQRSKSQGGKRYKRERIRPRLLEKLKKDFLSNVGLDEQPPEFSFTDESDTMLKFTIDTGVTDVDIIGSVVEYDPETEEADWKWRTIVRTKSPNKGGGR